MSILFNVFRDLVRSKPSTDGPAEPDKFLRVFIGYDERQPIAYHVLSHSIQARSSVPLAITPLVLESLPIERRGLTPFTYTRFLVPWLCNYQGWGLFLDLDMLVRNDIAELFSFADPQYAAMVVKNSERFEWASAILFNCAHPANSVLTPEYVNSPEQCAAPHHFSWLGESVVGPLPAEWNHTVGYDTPRADARLVHFTQGIPAHPEIAGCEYESHWKAEAEAAFSSQSWTDLMGTSVHAKLLPDGTPVPKLFNPDAVAQMTAEPVPADDEPEPVEVASDRAGASERYQNLIALYQDMHERGDTLNAIPADKTFDGRSLVPHLQTIADLSSQFDADTLLDYGCGKALAYHSSVPGPNGEVISDLKEFWGLEHIQLYDPGVPNFSQLPTGQFDGVISTDVLEHCPEQDVLWILDEMFSFSRAFVFCTISCQLAVKKLPTGENAHITVKSPDWWGEMIGRVAAKHPRIRYFALCYGGGQEPVLLQG